MYELLKEFIKPELLILIPVISIANAGIRKSAYIPENSLPLFISAVAIVLSALWIFATTTCTSVQTVLIGIFTSITQGILISGASIYIPRLIQQSVENNKTEKK